MSIITTVRVRTATAVLVCIAGVTLCAHAREAHFYVVSAVGPLPGQPGPTWAWDINDNGAVIGTAHINGSRESRCFIFEGGVMTVFASDEGHPFIWSGAINNSTSFVGTQMVTNPVGTTRKSFVGEPASLPDLFPQFPSGEASYGRDISNSVAGAAPSGVGSLRLGPQIGTGAFNTFRAYLVLLDGNPNPPIEIPALGGTFVRAEALNDSRDVVGASLTATGPLRAFLRTSAGTTFNLGTLGGTGSHSWATDINNAQQIVGWSRIADGGTRAFRVQGFSMSSLGTLGGNISEAYAISDTGLIVGMSFNAQARPRAFLFDENVGMIDLNTRIAATSGWILQHANALNESGAIVGWGRLQNETRGFVLTPREIGDATLDGQVDVDDLLAVILTWGSCASPCPADMNDDGVVNVDDLLAVITHWG